MTEKTLRLFTAMTGLGLALAGTQTTEARDFRITMIPNGNTIGCLACHFNPAGGGARTPFGQEVFLSIGGSPARLPFWSTALAARDSDGDGFCNGQELGDPEGDGTPIPGFTATNPGVSSSKPANSPPVFVSTPGLQAVMGLPYQYQAATRDPDACQQFTYSMVSGPAWLTVSTTGLVSGTPADGVSGDVTVTVQVADNGSSAQNTQQTYTLSVVSSFAAWQKLKFNLPSETSLAGLLDDPDGDNIVNLLEYAYRLDPRAPSVLERPRPILNGNRQMQVVVSLRDDDPKLNARMTMADTLLLTPFSSVAGTITDPTPGDGFKTWTFVDTEARADASPRFGRIIIELLP